MTKHSITASRWLLVCPMVIYMVMMTSCAGLPPKSGQEAESPGRFPRYPGMGKVCQYTEVTFHQSTSAGVTELKADGIIGLLRGRLVRILRVWGEYRLVSSSTKWALLGEAKDILREWGVSDEIASEFLGQGTNCVKKRVKMDDVEWDVFTTEPPHDYDGEPLVIILLEDPAYGSRIVEGRIIAQE